MDHASTRQQTDRAVGLWQHIYHTAIADTNTALRRLLLSLSYRPARLRFKKRIWFFAAVKAYSLHGLWHIPCLGCQPMKAPHEAACASRSLRLVYGDKSPCQPQLEGTTPKPRFWAAFFQTLEIPRDRFQVRPFHACAWKQNYSPWWFWWCWHSQGKETGSDVPSSPGSITQDRSREGANQPAQGFLVDRQNFVQNILATKAIFFTVKYFAQ